MLTLHGLIAEITMATVPTTPAMRPTNDMTVLIAIRTVLLTTKLAPSITALTPPTTTWATVLTTLSNKENRVDEWWVPKMPDRVEHRGDDTVDKADHRRTQTGLGWCDELVERA